MIRDYVDKSKWQRVRMRTMGLLFAGVFAASIGKAFYLGAVKHSDWSSRLNGQHTRTEALVPGRGAILDSSGSQLAVSVPMDSVYAEPRFIVNQEQASQLLAPILGMPAKAILAKFAESRTFVWLARRVEHDTAKRIKQLKLEGIGMVKESKRFYPNGDVASHLLGFTGLDPVGLEGIEKHYDKFIQGNTGYIVVERDGIGRDLNTKGLVVRQSTTGDTVVLTIDKNIQYIAEKELARAVAEFGAKGGWAAVMDPATGRLLAMATAPSFNPNHYQNAPKDNLRNRTITDTFEPGSTFKSFVVAAALEQGLVRPGDRINCENGAWPYSNKVIHDAHPHGTVTVAEVIKYSSNVGAAKIGIRMGAEKLYKSLRNFGFGEKSGIDLPGEVAGLLRDRNNWYPIDNATISFGQGVSVTAVQLLAATSAIANGGELLSPFIVDRIVDSDGAVQVLNKKSVRRRVISEKTAREMREMLALVTEEGGTGTQARVAGFPVAGKTGTAQKVEHGKRGYSPDKVIGSFVGFVPANNPKLTIIVSIDEPTKAHYGGVVAAPAFSAIATQSLCYLKVTAEGATPARCQLPAPAKATSDAAEVQGIEENSGSSTVMPDLAGMSIREALQAASKRGIALKVEGNGQAVEQFPPSGTQLRDGDRPFARFEAPAVQEVGRP